MVQNAATQDHGAVPMKLLQATSIASKMFRCQLTPVTALCVLQCRGTLIPKIPKFWYSSERVFHSSTTSALSSKCTKMQDSVAISVNAENLPFSLVLSSVEIVCATNG